MDKQLFVQNVKKYCALRGIKTTVACRESGAGPNLVSNIESGSVPSVEKVQQLAAYLGITTSELLGEEKKYPDTSNGAGISPAEQDLIDLLTGLETEDIELLKAQALLMKERRQKS